MRTTLSISLVLVAIADPMPRIAAACSPAPSYDPHVVDPSFATDTTPPGTVAAAAEVWWDDGDDDSGGFCMPPCGGPGNHIALTLSSSDDRTPADAIGYQIHVVGGSLPEGTDFPLDPVVPPYGDQILLRFSGESAFSVEIEIRAVDLNGNLGPAMRLAISGARRDEGGCAASGSSPPLSFGLVGLALVAALRRRRS
jgi:uncharacterized protein (TIGR03382 family)